MLITVSVSSQPQCWHQRPALGKVRACLLPFFSALCPCTPPALQLCVLFSVLISQPGMSPCQSQPPATSLPRLLPSPCMAEDAHPSPPQVALSSGPGWYVMHAKLIKPSPETSLLGGTQPPETSTRTPTSRCWPLCGIVDEFLHTRL